MNAGAGVGLRLLLFDIDGTLVDVAGSGRAALRTALLEVYGETGPLDTFDFHGRTDPAIVRGLLRAQGRPDDWIEARLADVWPIYFDSLGHELDRRRERLLVYSGVRELLGLLCAEPLRSKYCLGLVTGNMETGAWAKLRACELENHFSFGAFGSDSEDRDDLPGLARARAGEFHRVSFAAGAAVVIGDTPYDIQCARACGAQALAVATGRHTLEQLRLHGADFVMQDLSNVGMVLRTLEEAASGC